MKHCHLKTWSYPQDKLAPISSPQLLSHVRKPRLLHCLCQRMIGLDNSPKTPKNSSFYALFPGSTIFFMCPFISIANYLSHK